MIETLTLITLCMLYLIFFRPGKTPPLNNPLVIERPGKYHALLAPNLNLAQPLVEAIAQRLLESAGNIGNSTPHFFEVQDSHVTAHGHAAYLLAITKRNGMLYFQATAPVGNSDHLKTISEFSQTVLEKLPPSDEPGNIFTQEIISAVQQIAMTKNIEVAQIK